MVNEHEANIMAGIFIFAARVAKANDEVRFGHECQVPGIRCQVVLRRRRMREKKINKTRTMNAPRAKVE